MAGKVDQSFIDLAFLWIARLFILAAIVGPFFVNSWESQSVFEENRGLIALGSWVILWFAAFGSLAGCFRYLFLSQSRYFSNRFLGWLVDVFITPTVNTALGFVMRGLLSYAFALRLCINVYVLSVNDADSFNVKHALDIGTSFYFTVATAATVGFGDLSPSSGARKICSHHGNSR